MDLAFEVSEADLLAFIRHHFTRSAAVRRQVRLTRAMAAFVCLLALVLLVQLRGTSWAPAALAGLAFVAFLGMPRYLLWATTRNSLRMLHEGSNSGILGRQECHLGDSSLAVKSPGSQSSIELTGIERVDETPDHAFIYVSAVNAIVVPRESVQEGDYASFVSALRRGCEVARA